MEPLNFNISDSSCQPPRGTNRGRISRTSGWLVLSRNWGAKKKLMPFWSNGSSIGLLSVSVKGKNSVLFDRVEIHYFSFVRRKREADGFVRGIIIANNISREEAAEFFKVGRCRYDRLRNMDPTKAIPKRPPAKHRVTPEDKELVRIFMKAQAFEPGYPCSHRSTPVYMEDPEVTFVSLYKDYKFECSEREVRVLSLVTFRRIVKMIMPTLHLGRSKTDVCNACFSLDLQIRDPESSEELKRELIAAKHVHLQDAIIQRRVISMVVKAVQNEVAPNDKPLKEDPIFIPTCFKDPFDRLNRPFVVDYQEGYLGASEAEDPGDNSDQIFDLDHGEDEDASEQDTGDLENNEAVMSEEVEAPRKHRVSVQDYGSGIPLPHYGASQPNHDYYASNITLHNMNVVDCASGHCHIFYYDERQAGKDGNCVSSLRWLNTKQYITETKENLPTSECKILDNCVGQNKSNTTHKFSMLISLILFIDGVTDLYFRVGHSHNASDMKTSHAKKALAKKNLYTPQGIVAEVNKVKGVSAEVVDDRDRVFLDWKVFLDKHFPNMDAGFTSFYIFEFKNGIVHYKTVNSDGGIEIVKSKVFCADPEGTRKIILRELFNLSSTSNVVEICQAKPRLPPLPVKRISQKKVESMKTLYQEIPRSSRWFYPEGTSTQDDPHTDLRRRAAEQGLGFVAGVQGVGLNLAQVDPEAVPEPDAVAEAAPNVVATVPRNKVGRPKKNIPCQVNQPAIHRFFGSAAKVISNKAAPLALIDDPMEVDDEERDTSSESDDELDNTKGSEVGTEENDPVGAVDEYRLDFNHNDANRIVMTLKKK